MHDEIGPLLAASGMRLQLLQMDHPQTTDQVKEILSALDAAMERVRALSRDLVPPPDYAVSEPAEAIPTKRSLLVQKGK